MGLTGTKLSGRLRPRWTRALAEALAGSFASANVFFGSCRLLLGYVLGTQLSPTLQSGRLQSCMSHLGVATAAQLIKPARRGLALFQSCPSWEWGSGRCSKQGGIHLPVLEMSWLLECSLGRVSMIRLQPLLSKALSVLLPWAYWKF